MISLQHSLEQLDMGNYFLISLSKDATEAIVERGLN